MANRPRGFGLTAELNRKKAAKFDADLASTCFEWMKAVLEDGEMYEEADKLITPIDRQEDVARALKDGVVLCRLINVIVPNSVPKIHVTRTQAFKMMENINKFLEICERIGCKKFDLFQSVDLYESQNIPQVVNGIMALGRKAQNVYDGPALGPAESQVNKREFSEEQLRAGEGIINLQAGSNQGASQSGLNFGKTRAILD